MTDFTDATASYTDISHLNTMALKCLARELVYFTQIDEVLPTFQRLQQENTPFVIISNGSNIVLPPHLHACVISPRLMGRKIIKEDEQHVYLEVMAGEPWHELVVETVSNGYYGLENLALIPSSVGACPVQNIGAYGVQVQDVIDSITAFHIPSLQFKTLSNADCRFAYRDSIFKQRVGEWLITSVTFRLYKQPIVNTQYGDVATIAAQYAAKAGRDNQITPVDTMNAIIQIRESKIPDTKALPNSGSFFKNPIVPKTVANKLQKQFEKLVRYPVKDENGRETDEVKLAAGWLIEQTGLKGKGIAPILTHVHQALVLTNHAPNQATQHDIETTMQFIQDTVEQKFGIRLEPEPVWIEADGHIRQTH